ncbi:MAG TPA: urease subunit gamma [Jatrophihabitans sp.]|nr:urease subunit gamma [Jatrophihabitans sp.]
MHLIPREQERLVLFTAAELARRRLARGARLGATEAVALVCDEILEMAWDGVPLAEIVGRAGKLLTEDQLLPGVAGLVPSVQVEALFPHGTSLVHVPEPFGPADDEAPGAVRTYGGDIELAPGRERRQCLVRNAGHRPVWISSHYPLQELNPALYLDIDPEQAPHYRLDLPAGTSVRIEPDEQVEVMLVARRSDR